MKIIVFVKRNLFAIVFLLFVIFLVVFSNSSLLATKKGLNLWANNVVPSLFPFLVAAQLLSHTNFIYYLSKLCNSYMKPLFNVPGIGAFPFIMGIISGYPVGAKIISSLYSNHDCTKNEAERMLCFCNNSGPLAGKGAWHQLRTTTAHHRKDLSMSLVISDLSKSRHGTSLLNGVNLELRSGAIHGLFGRNGAGKSTLLNIIANRLVADAGSVSFDGNRMTDGGGMWERLMLMDETWPYPVEWRLRSVFRLISRRYGWI